MDLTHKQRLFVAYYLGKANGNGAEAARMAGYAKKWADRQAFQLLENSRVKAAIEAKMDSVAMPVDEVLARYSEIASADIGRFVEDDGTGKLKLNITRAKKSGRTRVIKKIRATKFTIEIELHSPLEALASLAKYHGLHDRGKSTSGLDDPPATDEHGNPIEP